MGSTTGYSTTSGLVAVLLITRSRPGPKLVFHYPARPAWPRSKKDRKDGFIGDSEPETDSENESESADASLQIDQPDVIKGVAKKLRRASLDDGHDLTPTDVLGYSADTLEKLLSPGRWCDRKRFEICLDGLTFVGHPIYANEDGSWPIKDVDPSQKSRLESSTETLLDRNRNPGIAHEDFGLATETTSITITAPETPAKQVHDFAHLPQSVDSQGGFSLATSMNSTSTASAIAREQMTMFHVVFAMSLEHAQAASDMYQHVAKKLSKALHYCQKQSSYVAGESRELMAVKSRGRLERLSPDALTTQSLEVSELAWALKETFEKIAIGNIAGIRLSGAELSLQIPAANPRHASENSAIGPHSGLLLLEDKEVLLRELANAESSPLIYFIRQQNPNKNLQKHAVILGLPVHDILYLARHLVKWRKARVITPLHQRSYYVVSPNAPLDRISDPALEYARKFPALPSLPQMLKILSGKPIKYGLLMPSRDHRGPYMDLLAYLVRHEYVVQLKTFAWLRRSKEEIQSVTEPTDRTIARPSADRSSLLSPHLRPVEDDNVSISSRRTVIGAAAAVNRPNNPHEDTPFILDPSASTNEGLDAVERIRRSLNDPEVRGIFTVLLPYLDGSHAFEEMAAKAGLKRVDVERCLEALDRAGSLLVMRHI